MLSTPSNDIPPLWADTFPRRRFERARKAKRALLSALPFLLVGCGGAALDATNVDTFERTFVEMIADMPEAEREALAQAILAVHADAKQERILPRSLPGRIDVEALLDPAYRRACARDAVRSSASSINGKTTAELLAMGDEVAAKADRNHAIRQQEQRESERARVRDQIAELEDRLVALQGHVDAAQVPASDRARGIPGRPRGPQRRQGSAAGPAPVAERGVSCARSST